MVIKAAQMGIPFLVSRSGLTQMGYEIAQKVGITMIGRATNKHFLLFTGGRSVSCRASDPVIRPRARRSPASVLAGGQGRRMGGVDKGLVELDGRPMVAHVLARLAPAGRRRPDQRQPESRPLRGVRLPGRRPMPSAAFAGPLAGLHAGMTHATAPFVVTVPCDSPFLPRGPRGAARARRSTRARRNSRSRRPSTSRIRCSRLVRRDVLPHLAALPRGRRAQDRRVVRDARDRRGARSTTRPTRFRNINTADELSAASAEAPEPETMPDA